MRQARANISRVLPLPPLVAAALLCVAALLAARLPRPSPIAPMLQWAAAAAPLGWYLLGAVLGPGMGLMDRPLLEASAPVIAIAVGWVAARAGAELARHETEPGERPASGVLGALGAFLLPAVLLLAAARWLLTPSTQDSTVIGPVVVTLVAAVALPGTARPGRAAAVSMGLAAAALAAVLLPHAGVADLKRVAVWLGYAAGGAVLCAGLAARLARRGSPLTATIAALCLGAGIGTVSGASPMVVCAVMGFVLARWSIPHARLAGELAIHEPTVTAVLWTTAGAAIGGPLAAVAIAAVLVALWPLGRRILAGGAPAEPTLGMAIAMNFLLTAGHGTGELERAVPTIVALGLLLVRVTPTMRTAERLTPAARRVEVSA
jgi:hypothetical protein